MRPGIVNATMKVTVVAYSHTRVVPIQMHYYCITRVGISQAKIIFGVNMCSVIMREAACFFRDAGICLSNYTISPSIGPQYYLLLNMVRTSNPINYPCITMRLNRNNYGINFNISFLLAQDIWVELGVQNFPEFKVKLLKPEGVWDISHTSPKIPEPLGSEKLSKGNAFWPLHCLS